MSRIIVPIKGMHCRSCELLVQDELSQLPGVKHVKASSKYHQVELTVIDNTIDEAEIAGAVARAGYELGDSDQLPLLTKNQQIWQQVGLMAVLVTLGMLLASKMGWLNGFGMNVSGQPASLLAVLLIGLTAGVSTCMALVGGLIMAITARFAKTHQASDTLSRLEPVMIFQLGRVLGFLVFGAILGMVGSVMKPSPMITSLLTVALAAVMAVLGLQLTGLFPKLANWSFSLPSWLAEKLGLQASKQARYSPGQTAVTGALTFFVPCGFTQSIQLFAASSGSAVSGAMIMGIFALGTLPGLSLVGSLGSMASNEKSRTFARFVGVVVVAMAASSFLTGLNLLGAANTLGSTGRVATTKPSGDVQEIRMIQKTNGYSPSSFTVKKGQPVRWIIDSQDSNSCASSILLAKYGINDVLKPGENVFEFTPDKTGDLKFSCGMGMYTGVIKVID